MNIEATNDDTPRKHTWPMQSFMISLLRPRTGQPITRRRHNFQQTVGIIYNDQAMQACGVNRNK